MNKENETESLNKNHGTYDIFSLISLLWQYKTKILLLGFFVLGVSYFSLKLIPNSYKSSAIIIVNNQGNNALSSLANQYGALGSLAGISLPSGLEGNKDNMVIEVIKSKKFMKRLLTNYNILPELFAAQSFDTDLELLIYNNKIYDSVNKKWIRKTKHEDKIVPSYQEAHFKFLDEILVITKNTKTGFIHLSIIHESPIFAEEMIEIIVKETNNLFREKDQIKSEIAISYLNDLLQTVAVQDIRKSINYLMTKELEQKMLADIQEDYIIGYIDPPFMPEDVYSPKRKLLAIITSIIFMMIASLYIASKEYIFKD